ncbi:MAG: 3-isopropylmalate dehydratase large subunit [Nitrososphaerales archaeon]|nr:3-isopropylmalate dehydratase large subunit [Nitrososphaerales archaeon]
MRMTITEKILARASGRQRVTPGEVVFVNVDKVMIHDVSGPGVKFVLDELERKSGPISKFWDPSRVLIVEDHFVPCPDIQSAKNIRILEEIARKFNVTNYFKHGIGYYGICHALIPEGGYVLPGEVYVGGDSHTNTAGALGAFATGLGHTDIAYVLIYGKIWLKVPETMLFRIEGDLREGVMAKDVILSIIRDIGVDGANYKAMEFTGSTIKRMIMDERFTLTNMSTECGAKNGIIEPDQITLDYITNRTTQRFTPVYSDDDAEYADVIDYEAEKFEPVVAKPFSPANVSTARELSNVEIDRAFIGSCTGGKLHDLREAAKVLKGRKVRVRTIIIPATQSIYMQALDEGLIRIFLEAGAIVGAPTCGPCIGGHMGVLGEGERCISATNRNFRGRMGHRDSETYLASPRTVAASAVKGYICDPRDLA